MKLILVILVVAFATVSVNGEAWSIRKATNPGFPGKCYDPNTKISVKKGTTKYLMDSCARVACSKDFTMDYVSCGLAPAPPAGNCLKVQDLSKRYPECCVKYMCT